MDLIALAIPFFLLAILVELGVDKLRGTGHFRSNDAINSLNLGAISVMTGYFTRFIQVIAWGFVLSNFALVDMPLDWFELTPSGLVLWAIAIIGWDFCYYWNHRAMHEVSVFWASHAVHHQSEDYNLTTALRQTSTSFWFSWVFYVPMFVIGFPLEVLVTSNALNLIYQFWVHTQHVDRLGALDRILVTPSNHRVHHAQNEVYIDRNYGGIFVLWDRMFGSFQEELESDPVVFGVRKPLASWNPFWANLQVYDYLLFDARHTKRWRDKLGIWFRRTGWRPPDVAEQYPKIPSDLSKFRKFDPDISDATRWYIFGQFAVSIVLVLGIGVLFALQGAAAVVIPCLLTLALLYTLGALSEGRVAALWQELTRLVVINPVGAWWMLQTDSSFALNGLLLPALAAYTAASMLGLFLLRKSYLNQLSINSSSRGLEVNI